MSRYIVEFDNSLNTSKREYIIRNRGAKYLGNIFNNFELIECKESIVEALKEDEGIINIEEDGIAKKNEDLESTDFQSADFPSHFIDFYKDAHDNGYMGDEVVVAVLDSGVNFGHEDLKFKIHSVARILDNEILSVGDLEAVKDYNGHGTAVTSIISMQYNNMGYVGVAPNASMMIIKSSHETESSMTYASMAKAIIWAVDNGANIINISYGQSQASSAVSSACQYAYDNNVVVVASAGNNGNALTLSGNLTDTERVNNWKDYPGVITVGAVKMKNNLNGKILPDLPPEYWHYTYRAIYRHGNEASVGRYILMLADEPITLEPDTDSTNAFRFQFRGYCQAFDLSSPQDAVSATNWREFISRIQDDFLTIRKSEPQIMPEILYSNHVISNNVDGGNYSGIVDMSNFHEKYYTKLKDILEDYDDTDTKNIMKAQFSSFGSGLDFVSPGYHNVALSDGSGFKYGNGTSYSTPYVSGIIALLKQRFKDTSVDDIYEILEENAMSVGDGNVNHFGNGMVNLPDLSLRYAKYDGIVTNKFYYMGQAVEIGADLSIVNNRISRINSSMDNVYARVDSLEKSMSLPYESGNFTTTLTYNDKNLVTKEVYSGEINRTVTYEYGTSENSLDKVVSQRIVENGKTVVYEFEYNNYGNIVKTTVTTSVV